MATVTQRDTVGLDSYASPLELHGRSGRCLTAYVTPRRHLQQCRRRKGIDLLEVNLSTKKLACFVGK